MKAKLFLSLILPFLLINLCFSQIYRGQEANNLINNVDLIRFKNYSKVPNYFRFSENITRSEQEAIEIVKSFITNSHSDLQLRKVQNQGNGMQTHRYYQTVGGFPIEFTALNLQVKNGEVIEVNGDILDHPEVSLNFLISEAEALQLALNFVNAEQYMWEEDDAHFPSGEQVIVPDKIVFEKSVLRAAYKFEIYSKMPFNRQMIYVDAENGEIILNLSLIHFSNVEGTAETAYYGERPISMNYNGSQYTLYDNSRGNGIRTYNCHNGLYGSATDFFNNSTHWDNTPYGTDAHFSTIMTYDYFFEKHGYNSINNAGFALNSYVHFNLMQYGYPNNVNAFWNGQCMTYGDGNPSQGITPLTTMDICGHEITHGLTQFTAGLIYDYVESGALNEAFSDIFGTALEFFAIPEYANWLMGDAMGLVIRNIQNPNALGYPSTYKGNFWDFGQQMHKNSTVFSHWFYLVTEGGSGTNDLGNSYNVTGMGISNAEQIAFKLLTQYLLPTSGYHDACFYGLQVASNLFGECSDEVKSATNAFYAIGVLEEPYNQEFPSFYADVTRSCDGIINFTDRSICAEINSWLWDFGDGRTSTLQHPTHQYYENGEYTVTLIVEDAEGQHFLTKTDYIVINKMSELDDHEFEVENNEPFELYIPNASSDLRWYTNNDDNLWETTPEFVGNPIQHPAITEDKIYYILDSYEGEEHHVGETSHNVNGGFFNSDVVHYLIFDAYQNFELKSVLVNASSGRDRQIMLRNAYQNVIWTKIVYIPAGISRVTIDKEIPAGTNLQLACETYPGLFRSDLSASLSYPYTIEDVVKIKESSASSDPLRYYYYFYDWEIKLSDCHSELAMVTINIEEEEEEENVQDNILQNVIISPNPSNGLFKIENLQNIENYTVTISEISGKILNINNLINGNIIDLSDFANGVYFVKIGNRVFKVIKN